MVALACAGNPGFVPSLLEAPRTDGRLHYSVATTKKVTRSLGAKDHLFFLLGLDAFLDLPHWKEYQRLLDLVDFIVVSRPGFSNTQVTSIVPPSLVRRGKGKSGPDTIPLRKSLLHILRGVDVPAASHKIRATIHAGRRVAGLVPPLVEEYILKEGLYRSGRMAKTR